MSETESRMKWILFYIFTSIYVFVTILTVIAIFFDVFTIPDKFLWGLYTSFVVETGVAVVGLFKTFFGIKKNNSNTKEENPFVETHTNDEINEENNSDVSAPMYYSRDYIQRKVASDYGSETGVIVIQYGSSTTSRENNDEDYIALIFNHHYKDDEIINRKTNGTISNNQLIGKQINIQEIFYDSFLLGILIGRPFEVSVVIDGRIKDHWNIDVKYFNLFRYALDRTLVKVSDLMTHIEEDTSELSNDIAKYYFESQKIEDSKKKEEEYKCIISIYHYLSNIIKLQVLRSIRNQEIKARSTYRLSKWKYLYEKIEISENKEIYMQIVLYFKNKKDWHSLDIIINNMNNFIKNYEREVVYE